MNLDKAKQKLKKGVKTPLKAKILKDLAKKTKEIKK